MRTLGKIFFFLAFTVSVLAQDRGEPGSFRDKLTEMLERVDQSIKLIREQITENQNAPFLPDLYLRLGELLSQKANGLYYVQMEKQGKDQTRTSFTTKFRAVVDEQKEAIRIYDVIIRDFPKYDKRARTLYLLALSQRSIDEINGFKNTTGQLFKEFPNSQEAMRGRLLLGQYYFDTGDFTRAEVAFRPLLEVEYPYERNLARYRTALTHLRKDKYQSSLDLFVKVATDDELKEEDNPFDVSLKEGTVRSSLKREALIDSIRAYTYVYKKDPKPVEFYSKISPTEVYFQEVIEKLAQRYIYLKKYGYAIRLLRALSERTADPQKVINIYKEVLLRIPIKNRLDVPVKEMKFLFDKYNAWINFYQVPSSTLADAQKFFEQQIRELGTTSHDTAKKMPPGQQQALLLERARDYYLLYLGFYEKGRYSSKISTNLGDVYFRLGDHLKSGEYYLRTFLGDFGKPRYKSKLIKNALLALQKPDTTESFYIRMRTRGLLINAIEQYMKFDRRQKRSARLNFALLKASYEQGFYDQTLGKLLKFIKAFKSSRYAVSAAELILDYFNLRSDYAGVATWTNRILKAGIQDKSFRTKISNISKQAKLKQLHQDIREKEGYDSFTEGKSYLDAALSLDNPGLADVALQEALAQSKQERDISTFFKAATALAESEKNPQKRASIQTSLVKENIRVGRYYRALNLLQKYISKNSGSEKIKLLDEAINLALVLKDPQTLQQLLRGSDWKKLPEETKSKIVRQIIDLLDSPVRVSNELIQKLSNMKLDDDALLSAFKAQYRLSSSLRRQVLGTVARRCKGGKSETVCKWSQLQGIDRKRTKFVSKIKSSAPSLEKIEGFASEFMALSQTYRELEGTGDSQLDIGLMLRNYELYDSFANFLTRVAKKNPDIRSVLTQRISDTAKTANRYRANCISIVRKANPIHPARNTCQRPGVPSIRSLLQWKNLISTRSEKSDLNSGLVQEIEKQIFVDHEASEPLLKLAAEFYREGHFHHSTAASLYGSSLHHELKKDFKSILGCSLVKLGLYSEAKFHLSSAGNYKGLRKSCLNQIESFREAL